MLTSYEVTYPTGVKQIWDVLDEDLTSFMKRMFGYSSVFVNDLRIVRIEDLPKGDDDGQH